MYLTQPFCEPANLRSAAFLFSLLLLDDCRKYSRRTLNGLFIRVRRWLRIVNSSSSSSPLTRPFLISLNPGKKSGRSPSKFFCPSFDSAPGRRKYRSRNATHASGRCRLWSSWSPCPVYFRSRAQLAGMPSDAEISRLLKIESSYLHIELCSRQAASAASARMGLK